MRRPKQFSPVLRSFLLTSLLTVLVFLALLDGPVGEFLSTSARLLGEGSSWSWVIRALLGASAVGLAVTAFLRARSRERGRRRVLLSESNVIARVAANPVLGRDPSFEDIRAAVRKVRETYPDETLGLFGAMLVDPNYRARMSERFTLERAHVRKTSRAEYLISRAEKMAVLDHDRSAGVRAEPGVLLVPLMTVRKGTLLADLVISDDAGRRLPELSQLQTMGLTSIALRSYFELTFQGVKEDGPGGRQVWVPRARDALWRLRQLISYRGIVSVVEFEALFDAAVDGLNFRTVGDFERFKKFCLYFAQNYYMACEAPVPSGFTVSVEIATDFSVLPPPDDRDSKLRTFFGMEPYSLSIDLDMAQFWPNYHAEIDGSDRLQYVYRQVLVDDDSRQEVDEEYFRKNGVDGQLIYSSEPGRISPRINVRNFVNPNHPRLRWKVFLDEVPPGALAPVLALSVITTALAFAFSFIVPSFGTDDFDAPALVIALPLFIVTFWGFSFEKLARSALATVAGFVSTAVLVVVCAMLVLTSPTGPGAFSARRTIVGLVPIGDFSWPLMICALLSLSISVTMFMLLLRRLGRYSILARRDFERSMRSQD